MDSSVGAMIGIIIIGAIVYFAIKAFKKESGIVADTSDKPKPPTSDEINDDIKKGSGN